MRKFALVMASALVLAAAHGKAIAQSAMVDGEGTRINEPEQKITLRHEPIPKLDMGSMTMVFRVKEPAMLKQVKVGDKVKFEADRVNGQLTVTKIQKR